MQKLKSDPATDKGDQTDSVSKALSNVQESQHRQCHQEGIDGIGKNASCVRRVGYPVSTKYIPEKKGMV
jgi:hypothetical protein